MNGLLRPALAALLLASAALAQPTLEQLPPLEQLTAPIALYPDPLLALVLPASTEPAHLHQAWQILSAGNDPDVLTNPSWGRAVADLAHYPSVIRWLAENPAWTSQLGIAFADEPRQVLRSIQLLRARALSLGTLSTGLQIRVVREGEVVEILPAQRDILYIPRYDPDNVFAHGTPGPYFTWSPPRRIGGWLGFYCNWKSDTVWTGDWRHHRLVENAPLPSSASPVRFAIAGARPEGREWRVALDAPIRRQPIAWNNPSQIPHPGLMQGAPTGYAYSPYRNDRYRETPTEPATFPGDSTHSSQPAPQQ